MSNTATKISIFIVIIFGVSTVTVPAQRGDLADRQWNLIESNGRRVLRSLAFVDINDNLRRFTGNTGCNQMFGNVSVRGTRIDFSAIGSTKRQCKLMAGSVPEPEFIRALDNAARYRIVGSQLSLIDRRGRTVLKFKAADRPTPEPGGEPGRLDLEDRKWLLEAIANRRTVSSFGGAFVNFGDRGNSAGGNTGCNVFGGSYSKSGTALSITDVISTMRACEEGDKMDVEREFLNGLRHTTRYEIRAGRLYLYRDRQLLLTFRGERK
jgi:heat shock protein HslJ